MIYRQGISAEVMISDPDCVHFVDVSSAGQEGKAFLFISPEDKMYNFHLMLSPEVVKKLAAYFNQGTSPA